MAGTVANLVYSNAVLGRNYDSSNHLGSSATKISNTHATVPQNISVLMNMDESDVLDRLRDESFNNRAEILEYLRSAARSNHGKLPFHDPVQIFEGLALVLNATNWNIRLQCILLINDLIANCDDLETCMSVVLPKIIYHFGDNKSAIKRAVVQTVHVYMKYADNVQPIFKSIVQFGLESNNYFVKKGTIVNLPMLLTKEFSSEDYSKIVHCLSKKLVESAPPEENLQKHVIMSLNKIKDLVGSATFNEYLKGLSPPLRKYYWKVTGADESTPMYTFGVVPSHIIQTLQETNEYRSQTQAVEDLKKILQDLTDVRALYPHTYEFIMFLHTLLDYTSFRVITVTLEIMGILVERLQLDIKPFLEPLVQGLSKRMDDNKKAVHQALMKVAIKLMQILSSKPVLKVLCENLDHKHSRVRQETLNLVIAALLTFPSYDFDLAWLCETIAPTLIDPKRLVRLASFECFALLAQAMGFAKLRPLTKAVDSIEIDTSGNYAGVLSAVQARLSRKQLPHFDEDGLVEYALPKPSSATMNTGGGAQNLDKEWIYAASGGPGSSARSTRSEALELESITSSARSTPISFLYENGSSSVRSTPRRFPSAGKRNRLPWEEDQSLTDQQVIYGYICHVLLMLLTRYETFSLFEIYIS